MRYVSKVIRYKMKFSKLYFKLIKLERLLKTGNRLVKTFVLQCNRKMLAAAVCFECMCV